MKIDLKILIIILLVVLWIASYLPLRADESSFVFQVELVKCLKNIDISLTQLTVQFASIQFYGIGNGSGEAPWIIERKINDLKKK